MEVRQLVQAKISQKKKTTANTESSTGSKDAVLPAEEESFAYRKLRQYFRWEYHNVWLAMDKERNLCTDIQSPLINVCCHYWLTKYKDLYTRR